MKFTILSLAAVAGLVLSTGSASAQWGGPNQFGGGHLDYHRGHYHYHNGGYVSPPLYSAYSPSPFGYGYGSGLSLSVGRGGFGLGVGNAYPLGYRSYYTPYLGTGLYGPYRCR